MKFTISILMKVILFITMLVLTQNTFAHSINYALDGAPHNEVVWFYVKIGFEHILPGGLDHILFVVGLCLLSTNIRTILLQATAFTLAHTITLILSMKNLVVAPAAVVEPIIALSIVFVAVENILSNQLRTGRLMVVFLFGLIHGMGFASALNEIGLPPGKFYTSLVAFNIGVELGQVAVIAAVFALLIAPLKNRKQYRKLLVNPLSACIGGIALYWAIERVYFM